VSKRSLAKHRLYANYRPGEDWFRSITPIDRYNLQGEVAQHKLHRRRTRCELAFKLGVLDRS
jgi:hypothetical protein